MSISYDIVTQSGVTKVVSQKDVRDLEPDDLEGAFTIHVTHGHLIRSLIHVLRDILDYGILELTPTTLRLLRLDKTQRVIVSINIDTSKFFQYLFVSKKGVIRIGIRFAVLWQCIKVIGKQDSFIMSKADGDEYVVLDFGNSAKQQYSLQGVCDEQIPIPVYQSRQPNVYITVKELTKAMSYLRTERERAHIKGYKDRIVVEALNGKKVQRMGVSFDDSWRRIGISPEELVSMLRANRELSCSLHLNEAETSIAELEITQKYAKYGSPGAQPTVDVVQSHLVLKSLSKIYTIAPNSSVLATVEAGKPLKLAIPIGDYGQLTLYLLENQWGGAESFTIAPPPQLAEDVVEIPEKKKTPSRPSRRRAPLAPPALAPEPEPSEEKEEDPEPVPIVKRKKKKRPATSVVETPEEEV